MHYAGVNDSDTMGEWITVADESQTLILTLDFDVQKSVHQTGNDKYIFKPTIKVIQG